MLAGQIAGLPSAWNCKHSGEGSLGHSRKVLNWGFLEELLGCLHSSFGTAANRVACDHCSVPSENYMRGKMLNIPLHTVNWAVVMHAGTDNNFRQQFLHDSVLFSY